MTSHPLIPKMVDNVIYLDFTKMPKYSGSDFALLVTCSLSRYTRFFPMTKRCNGETVLKELFKGWIQVYGLAKLVHSDRDIGFTSDLLTKIRNREHRRTPREVDDELP